MPEAGGMGIYTAAELLTKIQDLDAKIDKAETAQSYDAGPNVRLARGDLAAMYRERERLIKEYDKTIAATGGGSANKVQFGRPA
jgi:hypothetical protein